MDMCPGLGGMDCFDVARYIGSDVPSTRCALLDESSWREGHSCAEGVECFEPASSSLSVFFFDLRPGTGKENFPRLGPMMDQERGLPQRGLVACCWFGSTTQSRNKSNVRIARYR
jgi:hypothetical protein